MLPGMARRWNYFSNHAESHSASNRNAGGTAQPVLALTDAVLGKYLQRGLVFFVQSSALSASMLPAKGPQAPRFVRFGRPTMALELHQTSGCLSARGPESGRQGREEVV